MNKRIKLILILLGVSLIGIGIFRISKGIVGVSYSSEEIVRAKDEEEKLKQKKVEVVEEPKVIGVHGYNAGDNYLDKIGNILSSEGSPYGSLYRSCRAVEYDLDSGDKRIDLYDNDNVMLSIYCNNIDYSPYMFTKNTEFSVGEDEFFSSLANGETGILDSGEYYWLFH